MTSVLHLGPAATIRTDLHIVIGALRRHFTKKAEAEPLSGTTADVKAAFRIGLANKILLYMSQPLAELLSQQEKDAVSAYKFRTFQINSTLLRETLVIADLLDSVQTPFIFMKGALQQQQVHGDFFSRPVADIDVLLARSDHRRAAVALEQAGYTSASTSVWWRLFLGEEHLIKPGTLPVTIDLHYRVQQPGSPAPRRTSQYLDFIEHIYFMGAQLPCLARRNIPLLSAISIAKGLYNREATGAHVCDLYALLRSDLASNADQFVAAAQAQGLGGTALLALRAVGAIFGVPIPVACTSQPLLPRISNERLTRMILTPGDPELVWPMRRQVLWELCSREPGQFAKEVTRAIASETALRLFERQDRSGKT